MSNSKWADHQRMFDIVKPVDLCPDGHIWNYDDACCSRCGKTFIEYQAYLKSFGQAHALKCECGSSVAGGTTHAHYCPLYVKP